MLAKEQTNLLQSQNPAHYKAAPYVSTNPNILVKMEAFFSRGRQQAFP
jgi:hypothetical protein